MLTERQKQIKISVHSQAIICVADTSVYCIILLVVLAELAADIRRADDIYKLLFAKQASLVQFKRTLAVAAVPEAVVAFGSVRCLIADIEHILLLACYLSIKL